MRFQVLNDKKANKTENIAEIVFLRGVGEVKYNALYINKIMSILLKSARIEHVFLCYTCNNFLKNMKT